MMKPTILRSAALAALLYAALPWPTVAAASEPGTPTAASAAPAAVQVQPLAQVALRPERQASAQVVARNEARLAAEVGGVLQRWSADVGQPVRAGQELARLDANDLQLARDRARAARDAARARLELVQMQLRRARELQAQGFLSPEALNARETELALQSAELASAEAALQTAERQLAKAVIRAPFAGTVTQRLAQQGETVAPGAVLFVLAQTDGVELQAALSPAEVAELRAGAQPRFEADDGQVRAARLLRAVPTVVPSTRLQTVRLALQGAALPPGTAGLLRWAAPQPHVPAALLVRRGAQLGVFIVEGAGSAARARFVPLPDAQEGRPAPAAGLPDGARLVVRGQQALRDGQPVTLAP